MEPDFERRILKGKVRGPRWIPHDAAGLLPVEPGVVQRDQKDIS